MVGQDRRVEYKATTSPPKMGFKVNFFSSSVVLDLEYLTASRHLSHVAEFTLDSLLLSSSQHSHHVKLRSTARRR